MSIFYKFHAVASVCSFFGTYCITVKISPSCMHQGSATEKLFALLLKDYKLAHVQ